MIYIYSILPNYCAPFFFINDILAGSTGVIGTPVAAGAGQA